MHELPKIISVDDHVVEPAHVWQTWLPEKHRAQGPRIERRFTSGEKHVGGGAFVPVFGIASLDVVGEDNVTFETDHPHTDSTWPDTKQIATEMFAGLDDAVVRKLVRGNAIRMPHLDLSE